MDAAAPEHEQVDAEELLRLADALLRRIRQDAETQPPETVEGEAKSLAELLAVPSFPKERVTDYRDRANIYRRNVFQRSVDALLRQAEVLARSNDEKQRNEILTTARSHLAQALRFGVDDEFRAGVLRRVEAVMLTTGTGVDQRTKDAAARRLELAADSGPAREGGERRSAVRYVEPELLVTIAGARYRTLNWSIRGALLHVPGSPTPLRPGERLRLELDCPRMPGCQGRQQARVVRVGVPPHTVALEFTEISTTALALLRALKAAGTPATREP